MELIHHYTVTGYLAISSAKTTRDTLQHTVPRLAFSHDYLLHQILSFSALHLAYLHPETRGQYWHLASQHQNESIKGMRSALMQDVTSQSCHPLYLSSILLAFNAFGRLDNYRDESECDTTFEKEAGINSPCLDSLLDIFRSIHGISTILCSSELDLRSGPLKALFDWPSDPRVSAPHLQSVGVEMSLTLSRLPVPPTPFDEESRVIFEAGTSLIESIVAVTRTLHSETPSEMRAVFFWPIRASAKFVDLARRREPSAMVIIAHYCVLLHLAEESCWFLKGWAAAVLNPIAVQLRGTSFEKLIRWPTDTVLYGHSGGSKS
ncbi:hypothetical protein CDV36_003796 [Fusarium kuroshium]|uniref:Uncharacterized protein n=1 Tax=Fusarium kuroshium TaxID=2010991 RepID=A0A3M2SG39_9HYPO|nr:hypothetical protein CDV36_003796 [Fusarium kuroshium]